jgi:hypothetical protein
MSYGKGIDIDIEDGVAEYINADEREDEYEDEFDYDDNMYTEAIYNNDTLIRQIEALTENCIPELRVRLMKVLREEYPEEFI